MIKLVYCVSRRVDMPVNEFHEYWLNVHGPKVRSVAAEIGAVKYVQSHVCSPEINKVLADSRPGLASPFEGITEVWWESEEALLKAMGTTEGQKAMQFLVDDEASIGDFTHCHVFMSTEHVIFDFTSK